MCKFRVCIRVESFGVDDNMDRALIKLRDEIQHHTLSVHYTENDDVAGTNILKIFENNMVIEWKNYTDMFKNIKSKEDDDLKATPKSDLKVITLDSLEDLIINGGDKQFLIVVFYENEISEKIIKMAENKDAMIYAIKLGN